MPRAVPIVPLDPDAAADRVQMDLLRLATPARRAGLALSLTATVVGLARLALARQDPAATDEEIGIRFVRLHYGREIADGLAAFLRARRP
jgi:hypothetical protein